MRPANTTSSSPLAVARQDSNPNPQNVSEAPPREGLRVADTSAMKVARVAPSFTFTFADGSFSKWDVPTWQVNVVESRYRYSMPKYAVQAKHKGILTKNDHQILMTVAVAKALTEHQIRRACKPLTNSTINKRVDMLETWGLIERRKFNGERDPEQQYPGIITLTDTGKDYIRLTMPGTHCMGSSDFLKSPKLPINLIATNEIKLQLIEANALLSWEEHSQLTTFGRVASTASFALPDGPFSLVIERISSMAKIDQYLSQRIPLYSQYAQNQERLMDEDFALLFVVPSDACIQQLIQTYHIHELANTHKEFYPYVWFISHERLFSPLGFQQGILGIGKESIHPVPLSFGNADDFQGGEGE
ncbi:hypothetical protein ABHN11_13190 [Brevibacillus centrosporus]|uniref:MarR family transcriptional regulator n=1 Tax=Brevibacillus centrosporus TaxID=54910 RepID=UPI0039884EE0